MMKKTSLLIFLLFSFVLLGQEFTSVKVIDISDGDILTVLYDNKQQSKIRLHGIDCPEKDQPYATEAQKYASDLALGKKVELVLTATGKDSYGRWIGILLLPDGSNLNDELVKAGFAWWDKKFAPRDKELAALEAEARKEKRGLWADPNPIPPWEWRRGNRGEAVKSDDKEETKEETEDTGRCMDKFKLIIQYIENHPIVASVIIGPTIASILSLIVSLIKSKFDRDYIINKDDETRNFILDKDEKTRIYNRRYTTYLKFTELLDEAAKEHAEMINYLFSYLKEQNNILANSDITDEQFYAIFDRLLNLVNGMSRVSLKVTKGMRGLRVFCSDEVYNILEQINNLTNYQIDKINLIIERAKERWKLKDRPLRFDDLITSPDWEKIEKLNQLYDEIVEQMRKEINA